MYKLLVLDLDGTTLNDNSSIVLSNVQYAQKIVDAGVKVCLCSGRSYVSLQKYESMLSLDVCGNYGIGFNGGMVYRADTREVLRDVRLENSLALEIINELKKFDVPILAYDGETLLAESLDGVPAAYAALSGLNILKVENFNERKHDFSKIIVRCEYETLVSVNKYMKDFVANRCNIFFSAHNLLEFTGFGATKGEALVFLAEHLNIPISQTIAVGDNANDVSMVTKAGLGVAVKNAVEELKACANYVTKAANNDGVLKEIYETFVAKV